MEFARPIDTNFTDIQPSFFDLIAKGNFETLLPSLFEPLLAPKFPQHHKLVFYLGKAILDVAMVAGLGGTAGEVVYGLERSSKRGTLLVCLVTLLECHLLPFLSETTELFSSLPHSLRRLSQFLDLLVKVAYITSDCKSFSLLHFLTGISFKHSSTDIYERTDLLAKLIKTALIGGQLAVFLIQSGVLAKFKKGTTSSITSSTPPEITNLVPAPHPQGYPLPRRAGTCPCCTGDWKDPVVITSSGYVYCKKCLINWKTCPVTRIPILNTISLFLN